MSKEYFIRKAGTEGQDGDWEEVDEFLWANSKFVLAADGGRYYSDKRFSVFLGAINLSQVGDIGPSDLAIIARLVGVQPIPGAVPGGFFTKPQGLLRIKKGTSDLFYEVATGHKYRRAA